jgi:hypothetical protein
MSTDFGSAGYSTRPGTPPPQQGSADGIGSMLGGLLKDLQDLVRGEVALAKAEIKEDVSTAGKGVASLATAAFFGLTGFIFLMLGLTYLLNIWMRMWIAASIVGVLLVAIAAVLGMSGKKKLSAASLKPDQTIDSLKEDQQWAKEQISSVKK